jgi:hypothetical protein
MRKPLPAMVFLGLVSLAGTSFANNNESFRGISFAIGPSSVSVNTVVTTTGVAWANIYEEGCISCGSVSDVDVIDDQQFDERSTSQPQKYLPRLEIGYNFAIDQSSILGITISKDFGKTNQRWDLSPSVNVGLEDPATVDFRNGYETGYSTLEGPLAIGLKAGYAFTNSTMAYLKISYNQARFSVNDAMLARDDDNEYRAVLNNGKNTKTLDGVGLALGFESNLSKHIFLRGELEAIHYRSAKIQGDYCSLEFPLEDSCYSGGPNEEFNNDSGEQIGARWTDKYELRQHAGRLLLGVRF